MTNLQERALNLAERWANEPDRLSSLLRETMSIDQFETICMHLSRCFVALTAPCVTREACKLELLIQVGHVHSEITENIFMPLAEKMIATNELLEAA